MGLRVARRGALAIKSNMGSGAYPPQAAAWAAPGAGPSAGLGDDRRWGQSALLCSTAAPLVVPRAVAAAWGGGASRTAASDVVGAAADMGGVGAGGGVMVGVATVRDGRVSGGGVGAAGGGVSPRWFSSVAAAESSAGGGAGLAPPPPPSGEQTTGQLFTELQQRAARGKTPSAALLHRLLRRVEDGRDLRMAVEALRLCAQRRVPFSHHTGALILDACVRVGDLEQATDLLANHERLRLVAIGRETYHRVLIAASTARDEDLFDRVLGELRRSEHAFVPRTIHICVRAYVDFDALPRALDTYEEAVAGAIEVRRGTLNVLTNGIIEADTLPIERRALQDVVAATAAVDHETSRDLAARAAARLASYEAEQAAAAAAAIAESSSDEASVDGGSDDEAGGDDDEADSTKSSI